MKNIIKELNADVEAGSKTEETMKNTIEDLNADLKDHKAAIVAGEAAQGALKETNGSLASTVSSLKL